MNPWLTFSLLFLIVWLIIFLFRKELRKEMFWVSVFTAPFGLTEPLFVPEYWNPPSLFNLALKIGFDIESLIFSFAIGGMGAVIYGVFFKIKYKKMSKHEIHNKRHRFHLMTLISPLIIFVVLFFLTNLNPIYSAIVAMFIGGISAILCRPDLKEKVLVGGALFLGLYLLFFFFFNLIYPGLVKEIWNLSAISGILILGVPIEELMFAFSFGMLWSSVYEHIKWYKLKKEGDIKSRKNTKF